MKKIIFLLASLVLATLAVKAQGFGDDTDPSKMHLDWLKYYHGFRDDELRSGIVRMETDNAGNLYLMGRFTTDAAIDGDYFIPADYQPISSDNNLFVAKLSSDGTMLWHKALYKGEYPNEGSIRPIGMRLVGDSVLMLMAGFSLPQSGFHNRLYYLDTMLFDNNGYPFATDSSSSWEADGLIYLDPNDGSLLEHHFLQRALIDTAGNIVRYTSNSAWLTASVYVGDFDVDSYGNIFMARRAYDEVLVVCDTCVNRLRMVSPQEGSIGGIRLVVDGTRYIDYPLPYATGSWNLQLLKFAPHLDTLLDATYVVRSAPSMPEVLDDLSYISLRSFNIHNDRLCICLGLCKDHDSATVERGNALVFHNPQQSFQIPQDAMLIYDTSLQPHQLVQLDPLVPLNPRDEGDDGLLYGSIVFANTAYDAETDDLFLLGTSTMRTYTIPSFGHDVGYRGDSLALANNLFFLRLDPSTGSLRSYGSASTDFGFDQQGFSNIAVGGNRVFAVVRYANSVFFGDTAFYTASHGVNMGAVSALGLAQWDYAGHEVAFRNFHAEGNLNRVGPVALHDSALYFSGVAFEGALFDSVSLPGAHTFIGRYVDSALLQPYIHDYRHAAQQIRWDIVSFNDTVYVESSYHPMCLTATASSGLPVEYRLSNDSVAYVSVNSELSFLGTGCVRVSAVQPGNSYWYGAPPVEKVFCVGNTEGRVIWTQPLEFVYSDTTIHLDAAYIFGDTMVYYELPANNGVAELTGAGSHLLHLLAPGTVEIEAIYYGAFNPNTHDHQYHLTRALTVLPEGAGIGDIAEGSAVRVYPNPFRQRVSIVAEDCGPLREQAWLTDPTGRTEVVRIIPAGNGRYSLDLTGRPKAIYLLTLTSTTGKQHTVRLLKMNETF